MPDETQTNEQHGNPAAQMNQSQGQPPENNTGGNKAPGDGKSGNDKHPDFNLAPAKPGESRAQTMWVAQDEWRQIHNELRTLREFRDEQDKVAELAEAERVKLLTDKGQIQEAFGILQKKSESKINDAVNRARTIETKWLGEKSQAVINEAIAGKRFTGIDPKATAAMVRQLLGTEIEAILGPEGDPIIRDKKTLRPALDYLAERLNSPEFSLFFEASNRGGAGTDGARPAAGVNGKSGDPNKAFAEAYRQQQEDARNARFG